VAILPAASKDLGEILTVFHRISNIQPPKAAGYTTDVVDTSKLHERSKKAMAHHVKCVKHADAFSKV